MRPQNLTKANHCEGFKPWFLIAIDFLPDFDKVLLATLIKRRRAIMGRLRDYLQTLQKAKQEIILIEDRRIDLKMFLLGKIPKREKKLRAYVGGRQQHIFDQLFSFGKFVDVIGQTIMWRFGFLSPEEAEEAIKKLGKFWEGEVEVYISKRSESSGGWTPIVTFLIADEE